MKNKLWLCIPTMAGLIILFSVFNFLFLIFNCSAQGTWTQKTDFGGGARVYAAGFSIGTKGYICTGDSGGIWPANAKKDLWEWDQTTNIWTQKSDFGGTARRKAIGFSVGTKGYVGCGQDASGYKKDFWEYDPSSNAWTAKTNFGGTARAGATGFSVGTKGYAGTGFDASGYLADFWEYNPTANTWTQRLSIPTASAPRGHAFGFASGTKGWIGTGDNGSSAKLDFWEYDPTANTWTQRANFFTSDRTEAVGFFIGTKGYAGTGAVSSIYYQDLREYNPTSNTWTAQTSLTGVKRKGAIGFSIGTKGYIGTGINSSFTTLQDFWEFSPAASGVNEHENFVDVSVFPNPFSESTTIQVQSLKSKVVSVILYDVHGAQVKAFDSGLKTNDFVLERGNLPGGVYFYSLQSENKILATGKIIIE